MDSSKTDRGSSYFTILQRSTNSLNWLFLTLILFSGSNLFILYSWHFGNIKYAINREEKNLEFYQASLGEEGANVVELERLIEKTKEKQSKLTKLGEQGLYSALPILGLSFYVTDYIVVLMVFGTILFYWLYRNLRYCRNVLKEYYNSPLTLNSNDSELIASLFFYILPSGQRDKRYRYFEVGLGMYLVSLVFVFASDMFDIFIDNKGVERIFEQPGWVVFWPHIAVSTGITVGSIAVGYLIFRKCTESLKDIRNLVLLVKWDRRAFFPAVYQFMEDKKRKKLKEGVNLMEYRRAADSAELYLCITLETEDGETLEQCAIVDLPRSLKKYYLNWPRFNLDLTFDKYLDRRITLDELNMRNYFEKIISTPNYEPELFQKFSRIVKSSAFSS